MDCCGRYPAQSLRGSALGTAVGILPGAGADIAAWIAYACQQALLQGAGEVRHRARRGHRRIRRRQQRGAAGAWIPALVFGIPGDSITAIVIGVLYLKGLNPGPTIFMNNAPSIYAVFMVFILANLLMLPLGWAAIKAATMLPAARCAHAGDSAVLHRRRLSRSTTRSSASS